MSKKRKKTWVLRPALIAATVAVSTFAIPMASASAGFFDFLFGGGGGRRSAPVETLPPAPSLNSFADPSGRGLESSRRESGPAVAFCVRLCDGHPFPVTNASSAQACASMCPAAKTKVFAGSSVDGAVATDGKRYADLPTAFAYRKQLVANCTCNGKSVGGLARMDVKSDPTLRAGDIVATNQGLMSYRGGNGKSADFTPVQDRKLAEVKVRNAPISAAAANARAEEPPPRDVDEPSSKKSKNRAQR